MTTYREVSPETCPCCGAVVSPMTPTERGATPYGSIVLLWCEWTGGHITKDAFVEAVSKVVGNNL